ncbi:hypothetical protein GCM10027610_144350 [Dactylosporangium cerinum]
MSADSTATSAQPDGTARTVVRKPGPKPVVSTPETWIATYTIHPDWASTIIAAMMAPVNAAPVRDLATTPTTAMATRESRTTKISCSSAPGTATSAGTTPRRAA